MNEIIKKLEELDSFSIKNGVSKHYLEITKKEDETILFANKEGLVWLACEILKLAEKESEGSHIHIDENGLADRAETNLVISYKSVELK